VYILTINASIGLGSIYPLCFELGCEIGYPVKEGLVGCLVTIAAYLFLFLYYVIYLTPAFTNGELNYKKLIYSNVLYWLYRVQLNRKSQSSDVEMFGECNFLKQ